MVQIPVRGGKLQRTHGTILAKLALRLDQALKAQRGAGKQQRNNNRGEATHDLESGVPTPRPSAETARHVVRRGARGGGGGGGVRDGEGRDEQGGMNGSARCAWRDAAREGGTGRRVAEAWRDGTLQFDRGNGGTLCRCNVIHVRCVSRTRPMARAQMAVLITECARTTSRLQPPLDDRSATALHVAVRPPTATAVNLRPWRLLRPHVYSIGRALTAPVKLVHHSPACVRRCDETASALQHGGVRPAGGPAMHAGLAQGSARRLIAGFPPKAVAADDEQPVSSVLSHGDVVVVQSVGGSAPARGVDGHGGIQGGARAASTAGTPSIAASSILRNGKLVIREVPDDNSCLFRCVNALVGRAAQAAASLRTVVREAVAAQPALYGEAFLGRSNAQYQRWIMDDNSWGGAIELSILARHLKMELAAFDVKTMRLDRYGEGNGFATVGFLIYDGIHYNYVALALSGASRQQQPSRGSSSVWWCESDVTQFEVQDAVVVEHVRKLAQGQHDARKYTDTANAQFKCGECGVVLKGEQQVAEHAKQSGHWQFSER